jgi:hypothetical protein
LHLRGKPVAARQKNTIRTSAIHTGQTDLRLEPFAVANDGSMAWIIRHANAAVHEEQGVQAELRPPALKRVSA